MILASCRELVVARNDIGVNQKEICVIFFSFVVFISDLKQNNLNI